MDIRFNTSNPEEQERLEEQAWELVSDSMGDFRSVVLDLTDRQLGALVRSYYVEATHQSWEGFSFMELIGAGALLADLARTAIAMGKAELDRCSNEGFSTACWFDHLIMDGVNVAPHPTVVPE